MSFRKYTKAIVIVHGKSELDFVKHIKSKLRLPLEIYSRSNGKTSIQISSINDILKNRDFKTKKCFKEKFFKVECDKKGNPKNVKIFIIMDIDDTSQEKIDSYKSSTLFVKDWKKILLFLYGMIAISRRSLMILVIGMLRMIKKRDTTKSCFL